LTAATIGRPVKSGASIEHEDHDVGQRDRAQGSLGNAFAQRLASAQLEPAAIYDEKIALEMLGLANVEVARGSGDRTYDRTAAARDAVKQRRFARVGAADQHHHRRTLRQRSQGASAYAVGIVRGRLHLRAPTRRSCADCASNPCRP
jgi:hypothetical protein